MKFEINNASFLYKNGGRRVLDGVSLSASSGDVLAVLGPNGAGKTTLLRAALGFLKLNSGEALLDGVNINTIKPRMLWRKIAYVPQARQSISPYTVEETVLLGRSAYSGAFGGASSADYEKAEEVIDKLKLGAIRRKSCSEISGGELQMVLIARALVSEPRLLILDEPESNLDFKNQLLVLDTISSLAEAGTACLFNTHYPAHALRRANKALMLSKDGKSIYGDATRIVTEKNISEFFGVNAVIGEIETETNSYRDVVAISAEHTFSAEGEAIATVSIILSDTSAASQVNRAIHTAQPWIIGRMGMPVDSGPLHVINLVLKAPIYEIHTLSDMLNRIKNVSAKVTYARGKQ